MALNYFLIYLGVLFSGSLLLWMLIKSFAAAFAAQGKKPLIYGIVSGIITGLAALGITYAVNDPFIVFWCFAGLYLAYGTVHMALVHAKFYKTKEDTFWKLLTGELLFAICVLCMSLLVFSAAEFFLKDRDFLFYPVLVSALFFFAPLLFYHAYKAAQRIPHALFPTWQYPIGRSIDPPEETEGERLLVVGFEIAKKNSDVQKTYFRARAPEGIRLGELFYHFINDYNELQSETPIQFADNRNQPYDWWFRIKPKWYNGQRILEPADTVKGNGIRENTIIICERIENAVTTDLL
jgi:hypothetical protein